MTTDLEQLKSDLPPMEAFLDEWCEPAPNPQGRDMKWVCPKCGSGKSRKGTPALGLERDKDRWHCFSCGAGGDALDLAEATGRASSSFEEQLQAVCGFAGIDPRDYEGPSSYRKGTQNGGRASREQEQPDEADSAGEEVRGTIARAAASFWEPCGEAAYGYALSRGFTTEECWSLGFGALRVHGVETLLIPFPTGDYWYARAIESSAGKGKYYAPSGVKKKPWRHDAKPGEPVWLVEGQIDALALTVLGFHATCMSGAENADEMRYVLKHDGPTIVAMDNDETGREASRKALDKLRAAGRTCVEVTWAEVCAKDAGEVFQRDRKALETFCKGVERDMRTRALEEKGVSRAIDLLGGIMDPSSQSDPFPTGLDCLDAALDGGLPAGGVAVVGAVSSAGKTTFCIQVADHMAAQGHPVLFVTCEQSAREVQAKSVVRMANDRFGVSLRLQDVLTLKGRENMREAATEAFMRAVDAYGEEVAQNLYIMQPEGRPTPSVIRGAVEAVMGATGEYPALFVDYLQLLGSDTNPRADAKACADEAITALRQIARKTKKPVVVISSLSRGAYNGTLSLESFKESGGIEYGADLLLGLEPLGMEDLGDGEDGKKDATKAKAKAFMERWKEDPVRDVRVTVLKNRNGACLYGRSAPALRFNVGKCAFYDAKECGLVIQPKAKPRVH